ncbi:MAG: exo-alpha-sialidase [Bryobacterales bacterium]|nr:exo-alpha-sialidase [Bryobacterales bacterium]
MKRSGLLLLLPLLLLGADSPTVTVFRAGEDGYHTFRIPALVVTKKSTLLAFCEGRKNGQGDSGDIDVVLKRSSDDGKTWSALEVVADHGPDTIGNPAPVVDRKSGTIWLLLTGNPGITNQQEIMTTGAHGTRTVWITSSKDDGKTWQPLQEITSIVKRPDWMWYATGPANAIQMHDGRMMIPCDHSVKGSTATYSHVIYSPNRGISWEIGGILPRQTNECAVVQLEDRSLLLNMRNNQGTHRRAIATSHDGGDTWENFRFDDALVDPTCQASMAVVGDTVFFANPADSAKRIRMTVRASHDNGKHWPETRVIWEGPSAYSSMVPMRAEVIGLLYERGEKNPYETIVFTTFPDRI